MLPITKIQREGNEQRADRFTPSASQVVDIDSDDGDDDSTSTSSGSSQTFEDEPIEAPLDMMHRRRQPVHSTSPVPQAAAATPPLLTPHSSFGVGALMLRHTQSAGGRPSGGGMNALLIRSTAPSSVDASNSTSNSRQPSDDLVLYRGGPSSTPIHVGTPSSVKVKQLLVLGSPQCGKSSFINAYRTAVAPTDNWPLAPTGICGLYGTTSLEVYPNDAQRPTWLLIDTPGRVYEDVLNEVSNDFLLLENLFRGLPWKTRLRGPGCLDSRQIAELPPSPQNAPQQCVIVLRATDLIEDKGWLHSARGLLMTGIAKRYTPTGNSSVVVHHLQQLIAQVRVLMHNEAPYVAISHMDCMGGTSNRAARSEIVEVLRACCPPDRIVFFACTTVPGSEGGRGIQLDGHSEMRRLHRELSRSMAWSAAQE